MNILVLFASLSHIMHARSVHTEGRLIQKMTIVKFTRQSASDL